MSTVMPRKEKIFKIFVISDTKILNARLHYFLNDYVNYELHFVPKNLDLFDILNFNPDVIVMDEDVNNVIKCHEWGVAA